MSDHTYQSRLGESGLERDSWNHGWSVEVWFMTRSAITRIRRAWAASISSRDVVDRAVVGVDLGEVGDVVAAVAQRRGVERQQPDAVDPEPLQVVELLGQAAEVARAVAVGVEEAADVDLVEDGALEPQRLGLEPLARSGPGRLRPAARGDVGAGARLAGEQVGAGSAVRRSCARTCEDVRLAHAGLEADDSCGPIRHW